MDVDTILSKISNKLTGRIISKSEKDLITKTIDKKKIAWYIELLTKFRLVETSFSLSQEYDMSEMGVELKWLTPDQTISEAKEAYPGIIAFKNGLLPIGMCLEGSGDPYFIKISNGPNTELVRVIHDSCINEGLDPCKIEIVCNCLSDFFQYSIIY